ncbi:nucleotidyltransferase family protein [Marinomonas ostreistagni]|uniref:nucleotidyltransferase family protein n=1 Tax=Marinomonas ostreistagni TaxID=359209 RepID=UPI001950EF9A|nr:nucleotidyltransferase family protein [Marinomonas ostreistagni]MBM6551055.1 nucleotidyltransferase family protein [Marinomonas ostreistagni]
MSHSWQKALVSESSSIKEALKIIDSEALRVALAVSPDRKLLGVITDGDIRRALLRGLSLEESVSKVMNTSPIIAFNHATKDELVTLMEKHQVLSVPLVSEEGVVTGLETLHSALSKKRYQNPIFIMAGGFGTRLKPLTDNCPKPMLKVGDKPILETVIKSFIKAGFSNFYISTHYMPEQIHGHFKDGEDLGVSITYVHEDKPLGTGGALGLLPGSMPKDLPLIMINGDVLTNVNFERLLKFHEDNNADATMCVREYDYQIPYGVINGEGNKITSMVEKPVHRFFINAGIYVLSPQVINSVAKNEKIDMPSLLEKHMNERQNVLMFPIHEYWLDIGRMDDFNRAQTDILNLGL